MRFGEAIIKAFPNTRKNLNGWQSPAERLNQFYYHENWLQNLLVLLSDKIFTDPKIRYNQINKVKEPGY